MCGHVSSRSKGRTLTCALILGCRRPHPGVPGWPPMCTCRWACGQCQARIRTSTLAVAASNTTRLRMETGWCQLLLLVWWWQVLLKCCACSSVLFRGLTSIAPLANLVHKSQWPWTKMKSTPPPSRLHTKSARVVGGEIGIQIPPMSCQHWKPWIRSDFDI